MAIIYGTLAKDSDGKIVYVYPKTSAAMVEYSVSESVEDKINSIDTAIKELNDRIDSLLSLLDK